MIKTGHLEVYDLTLTAKAPVFVGSGKSYTKKEYLFLSSEEASAQESSVWFLDEEKFFQMLIEQNLIDKYEQFVLGRDDNCFRFLRNTCRLSMPQIRTVTRYQVRAEDALDSNHTLKEINAFSRNQNGQAYIPGSSLKGALRTVLLTEMILKEPLHTFLSSDYREDFPEGDYLNTLALRKDKYGNTMNDAVNSIMRGILISDSAPIPDSHLMLTAKTDSDIDGNTHQINLCRECVSPGTKVHFKLTLDNSVLKGKITAASIRRSIRTVMDSYLDTWISNFDIPYKGADISFDNCIFLGGGTGFYSKTLVYPYLGEKAGLNYAVDLMNNKFRNHKHLKDKELGVSPRTMKFGLYNGFLYPMGLCEVELS